MADQSPAPQLVTVTDVDIKFTTLVWLLVKVTLAAIPAALIIVLLAALVGGVLRGIS